MTRGAQRAALAAGHPRVGPLAHEALPARLLAMGDRVVADVARLPGRRGDAGSANIAAAACRGNGNDGAGGRRAEQHAAGDDALDVAGWREIETRGTGTHE